MVPHYSLHEPRNGHDGIKGFMAYFQTAFPDLNFWGAADLIAEGDYVVGRWEGGGTPLNTVPATARYPAIVTTIVGRATGVAMIAALMAASAKDE